MAEEFDPSQSSTLTNGARLFRHVLTKVGYRSAGGRVIRWSDQAGRHREEAKAIAAAGPEGARSRRRKAGPARPACSRSAIRGAVADLTTPRRACRALSLAAWLGWLSWRLP